MPLLPQQDFDPGGISMPDFDLSPGTFSISPPNLPAIKLPDLDDAFDSLLSMAKTVRLTFVRVGGCVRVSMYACGCGFVGLFCTLHPTMTMTTLIIFGARYGRHCGRKRK
jgi:hypothetical protein